MKSKIIKLSVKKKNWGRQRFLKQDTKSINIKRKSLDYIKIHILSKYTIKSMKSQAIDWKKIFTMHTSDKSSYPVTLRTPINQCKKANRPKTVVKRLD